MPTIPTGKLERELRRLYMRWVHQLPKHEHDLHFYIHQFQQDSVDLIERMGGDIARLGALAGFPAPKRLDLSLHIGTIYSDMETAAIWAQIRLGLNPKDTARELVRAGVDKSYRRLVRLARTETVSAYWRNAWDSIEGLDMVMIWGAEDGPRTCEWCKERDGMVIEGAEVRDHPNGRCTPIPTPVSMVDYKGSVLWDGTIYQDKNWATYHTPAAPAPVHDSLSHEAMGMSLDEETALEMLGRFDDLSPEQQAALREYQKAGYTEINGALRGDYPPYLIGQEHIIDDLVKHLDSVMLPLGQDVTLYRGQGYRTMLHALGIDNHMDPPEMWDLKGKIGTQIRQSGYYSTSISEFVATEFIKDQGFLINIEVPSGVGAHYVQTGAMFSDDEKEMLLQRGLDFVLTDAELIPDPRDSGFSIWRITLRAVP